MRVIVTRVRRVRIFLSLGLWLGLLSLGIFSPCSGLAKPILLINVRGHYGVQRTEISKETDGWACKTELTPYHFSPVQPYSDKSLSDIKKAYSKVTTSLSECRDSVVIEDRSARMTKKYSGCADQIFFASFLREMNRQCGRN